MTGKTRAYLSDLANRKGIRYENAVGESQAWASDRIEELKLMPDATFEELSNSKRAAIEGKIKATIGEINKWTFTQ